MPHLKKRIEELEKRLNKNSSNSNKPPSSDSPFEEKPKKKSKSKKKKRRKGFRQKMLEPTEVKNIIPELCICGNTHFDNTNSYYTHQVIELPEIKMEVTHFVLHKGQCSCCGKVNKAVVPNEHRTGFGPRLSAMIAQMAGNMGDSRTLIQDYCSSVWDFISAWEPFRKSLTVRQKPLNPIMRVSVTRQGRPLSTISMKHLIAKRKTAMALGDGQYSGCLFHDPS